MLPNKRGIRQAFTKNYDGNYCMCQNIFLLLIAKLYRILLYLVQPLLVGHVGRGLLVVVQHRQKHVALLQEDEPREFEIRHVIDE